ncbi:aspartate kinase [Kaistella palustris]|uniref:aspartate kinase n=1 Tax=Kaistella palustris TaxID=493376 RepID=UPI0003F9A83D|nr:aspartate kinase [Kaistella palustris]
MKVFKFGGASLKDADGVKNVAAVLNSQKFENCLLVVSAMGKTTNALEKVVQVYFEKSDFRAQLAEVEDAHLQICRGLFSDEHPVFQEISFYFKNVEVFLQNNVVPDYNFVYDQVVSCGEMVSSRIVSLYLNEIQFANLWLDARKYIITDTSYREGNINWDETQKRISALDLKKCYVTQGFIGAEANNFTVTLGREGSDYSAAIFAYGLNAEAMTIWKDVPGVMTGDPRKFENVSLISDISYEEAIEMAYYGASVIHPKTLQPLKQKNIPFYVKSFLEPEKPGTKVGSLSQSAGAESYILKENQHLMHISTRDFAFIAEEHLSQIFALLAKNKIKISLMQNSAISLALCLEDKYGTLDALLQELQISFNADVVKSVSLYTLRNAKLEDLNKFYANKNILLEQISKKTIQIVTN